MRLLLSFVCSILLLAGCGEGEAAPAVEPTPPSGLPARLPEVLRSDLANRLDVDQSRINIIEFCSLTWPDGSLGVAEPGRAYTQALVEGWLAILAVAGDKYRFHGAGDRFVAADFVPGAAVLDSVRCP